MTKFETFFYTFGISEADWNKFYKYFVNFSKKLLKISLIIEKINRNFYMAPIPYLILFSILG